MATQRVCVCVQRCGNGATVWLTHTRRERQRVVNGPATQQSTEVDTPQGTGRTVQGGGRDGGTEAVPAASLQFSCKAADADAAGAEWPAPGLWPHHLKPGGQPMPAVRAAKRVPTRCPLSRHGGSAAKHDARAGCTASG